MVAWTLALVVASAVANAASPGGGTDQLLPYFVSMVAITVAGGTLGCWVSLAAVGERWARRTGISVLILFPILLIVLELGVEFVNASGNGFVAVLVMLLAAVFSTLAGRRIALRARGRPARA
jgi:hypothetical protein